MSENERILINNLVRKVEQHENTITPIGENHRSHQPENYR